MTSVSPKWLSMCISAVAVLGPSVSEGNALLYELNQTYVVPTSQKGETADLTTMLTKHCC